MPGCAPLPGHLHQAIAAPEGHPHGNVLGRNGGIGATAAMPHIPESPGTAATRPFLILAATRSLPAATRALFRLTIGSPLRQ